MKHPVDMSMGELETFMFLHGFAAYREIPVEEMMFLGRVMQNYAYRKHQEQKLAASR